MALRDDQRQRYNRHLILQEIGEKGQQKLLSAKVCIVGAGGLGSAVGYYLTAAGVGTIAIIDSDVVELSNLQRQIIHSTDRVGEKKIDSARSTLSGINPNVEIETHEVALTSENALSLYEGYDLIVDGTDNFPTRYLVNDACSWFPKTATIFCSCRL